MATTLVTAGNLMTIGELRLAAQMHYNDAVKDTPTGSFERAAAIQALATVIGVHDSQAQVVEANGIKNALRDISLNVASISAHQR